MQRHDVIPGTPTHSEAERSSSTNSLERELLPPRETRVADYTEELETKFQSFLLRVGAPNLHKQIETNEVKEEFIDSLPVLQKERNNQHEEDEEEREEDNLLVSGVSNSENTFHLNLDGCVVDETRGDDFVDEFMNEGLEGNIAERQSPECPLLRRVESPFISLSEDIFKAESHLEYTPRGDSNYYPMNEPPMNRQRQDLLTENDRLQGDLQELKKENLMIRGHAKSLEKELQSSHHQTLEMQRRHENVINSLQTEQKKLLDRIDQLTVREITTKSKVCSPFSYETTLQPDNFQDQINQLHQTMEDFREDKEALRKQIAKYEERLQNILRMFESKELSWDSDKRAACRSPMTGQKMQSSETLEGNEMVNALRQELPKAFRHAESLQKDMETAIKNLQTVEENIKNKLLQQEKKMETTLRERQSEWFEKTKASQEDYSQKLRESEMKVLQLESQLKEKEKQEEEQNSKFLMLQGVLNKLQQRILREVNQECRNMKMVLGIETKSDRQTLDDSADVCPAEIWEALANLRAHSRELCKLVGELNETNDHLNDQIRSPEPDLPVKENEVISANQRQWMTQWKDKVKDVYSRKIKLFHIKHQEAIKQLVDVHQHELSQMEMRIRHWKETMVETMASRLQKEFQEKFESRLSQITAAQPKVPKRTEETKFTPNGKDMESLKSDTKNRDSRDLSSNMEVFHELKSVIQQLREENISLRRLLAGNVFQQGKCNGNGKDLSSEKHGAAVSPTLASTPNLGVSRKV